MTNIARVSPNDPLRVPAAAYNAFVDAARRNLDVQVEDLYRHQPSLTWLYVRNTTGTAQSRFAILGLDIPVFDDADNLQEFQNNPALDGVVPTSSHAGRWCVLLEDLPDDGIGRACLAGVTVAQIDVIDTDDERADATPSSTAYLTSDPAGSAQIIWKQSGTGVQWSIIRIGDFPPSSGHRIRFCIVSAATVGGVVVSVEGQVRATLCGSAEVPEEDASGNVTIYDGMGCMFDETAAALIGRQGWATYVHQRDYDDPACGTTTLPGTGSGQANAFYCRWEVDQLCCPP